MKKTAHGIILSAGDLSGHIACQIRKVTKNKGAFTIDMALLKLIYLAAERIAQKWTMPLQGWAMSASQLKIIFGNRMRTDL